MTPDFCTNCEKRNDCAELCLKAEEYVNQDYMPLRELSVPPEYMEQISNDIEIWSDRPEKSIFTKRERQVLGALLDGKTRKEIAQVLGITRKNLREIIRCLRKKRQNFSLKNER